MIKKDFARLSYEKHELNFKDFAGLLVAIIFKEIQDDKCKSAFSKNDYEIIELPGNPFI